MTSASRSAAIDAKCRDCIHDSSSPGTWREQVGACDNGGCALHPFRPVPRYCKVSGCIDKAAISALRARLEAAYRASPPDRP